MKIYRNTFLYFRSYIFIIHQYIRPTCKIKEMTGPPRREKKSYITKVTLPIYSEGSNECTIIPRNKFLTLHKFYVSKVYNWIRRNFFIGYKMPQNRKNRQKTGKILIKSFWIVSSL